MYDATANATVRIAGAVAAIDGTVNVTASIITVATTSRIARVLRMGFLLPN